MTTVPPAQALVRLATLLAAAGCRFLPDLYTIILTLVTNPYSQNPNPS